MEHFKDAEYRTPDDLATTPIFISRVVGIGSCLLENWVNTIGRIAPDCNCEFYSTNNGSELPQLSQCLSG